MKKNHLIVSIVALFILSTAFTSMHSWKIAKGYSVNFSTEYASGNFETVTGRINFEESDLTNSYFNVTLDVNSIATGNFLKNKHARGDNWLEAAKYPVINFTSTKITKTNEGFLAKGNLTMHGITKSIEIHFIFTNNTFKGKFSVNRTDYKVGSMEGMSKKVGNKIDLDISVPVTK